MVEATGVRERPRPSSCSVLTDLIFTVLASEVIGTGAGTIVCLIVTAIASIHTETGCWREEISMATEWLFSIQHVKLRNRSRSG